MGFELQLAEWWGLAGGRDRRPGAVVSREKGSWVMKMWLFWIEEGGYFMDSHQRIFPKETGGLESLPELFKHRSFNGVTMH